MDEQRWPNSNNLKSPDYMSQTAEEGLAGYGDISETHHMKIRLPLAFGLMHPMKILKGPTP